MKKKILLGSIFVLALLLLMPSIPAVQQKTINDKVFTDFSEEFNYIIVSEPIKHQALYDFIVMILIFRMERGLTLFFMGIEVLGNDFRVKHPLLCFRGMMIMITTREIASFWDNISDTLGWNWENLTDMILEYILYW